jgi:hypothetical protein
MGQAVLPTPISVTCSKWYMRKALLFSGLSLWTTLTEPLPACLINLLPESLGSELSLCLSPPATFLEASSGIWRVVFSPSCHRLNVPGPRGLSLPGITWLCWSRGGSLSPSELRRWVPVAQRNLERLGNQPRNPTHQTGKNTGSDSGLSQEGEGESDQLSKDTHVTTFFGGVETMSFRFREQSGSTVMCKSVWKWEPEM